MGKIDSDRDRVSGWAVLRGYRTEILTVLAFVGFLFANPRAQADQIRSISHGEDAFLTFAATIREAKKTIDVTTFIFGPCTTSGRMVADELKAAAKRGVRVRILLDPFSLEDSMIQYLAWDFAASRIQFRVYNDGPRFLISYNPRTHVKLLVADGETYISGGRNLSNEYFGFNHSLNFVDQDLWIRGQSARDAQASFNELWNSRMISTPRPSQVAHIDWVKTCALRNEPFLPPSRAFEIFSRRPFARGLVHDCDEISYSQDSPAFLDVVEESGVQQDDPRIDSAPARLALKRATKAFAGFLKGTRKSLEVVNWSYIPDGLIRDMFDGLRRRQVRVQVLSNLDPEEPSINFEAGNSLSRDAATRDNSGTQSVILISGHGAMTDRHVLTPMTANFLIHAKYAIRDGRDVLVSSFNLDARSTETNLEEVMIVRNCPGLAVDLHAQVQELRRFYVKDVQNHVTAFGESNLLTKVYAWLAYDLL